MYQILWTWKLVSFTHTSPFVSEAFQLILPMMMCILCFNYTANVMLYCLPASTALFRFNNFSMRKYLFLKCDTVFLLNFCTTCCCPNVFQHTLVIVKPLYFVSLTLLVCSLNMYFVVSNSFLFGDVIIHLFFFLKSFVIRFLSIAFNPMYQYSSPQFWIAVVPDLFLPVFVPH